MPKTWLRVCLAAAVLPLTVAVPQATAAPHQSQWEETAPDRLGAIRDIKAFGPNAAWAVGHDHEHRSWALRWDGRTWTPSPVPALNTLRTVEGTSPDDVWALGRSGLAHWDGGQWRQTRTELSNPLDALTDLTLLPDGTPLAVGYSTTASYALRWNGTVWKVESLDNKEFQPQAVASLGSGQAWAVGNADHRNVAYRYTGQRWEALAVPGPDWAHSGTGLKGVAANGPADVWLAAESYTADSGGVIRERRPYALHWDGQRWTQHQLPGTGTTPLDVHWDGRGFWVSGSSGTPFASYLARWDGSGWRQTPAPAAPRTSAVYALEPVPGTETWWAVGNSTTYTPSVVHRVILARSR